jgi:hypothetical protein
MLLRILLDSFTDDEYEDNDDISLNSTLILHSLQYCPFF